MIHFGYKLYSSARRINDYNKYQEIMACHNSDFFKICFKDELPPELY